MRRVAIQYFLFAFIEILAFGVVWAADADKFLAGRLLIASTEMQDPRFAESVIYMVEHDSKGALGLIINQPALQGSIEDLLKGFGINNDKVSGNIVLHYGGPVSPRAGIVLHSDDVVIDSTKKLKDGIAVTVEAKLIELIGEGKGPRQYLVMLGYAGWAPGQLEGEIIAGSWHTIPSDKSLIFGEDADKKWRQAMERRQVPL
ncbi:MAG: YqgE/AlgH family protein [Deltaproteobacteria bacterium]|nr:YqgE/AlgH family protein [Deltaproteobacteria bacterium]MBM4299604.1 YqgE/AlgH family protein [Deltaproteobacteria bacterium]